MFNKKYPSIPGLLAAIAAVGLFGLPTAGASQIFIQQSGTSAAGGDPNLILDPSAFTVGLAGNSALENPLLVIIGVYDGNGMPPPSISFSGCTTATCPAAPVGLYGLTSDTGTLNSQSSGTAFAQLGLAAGGSESFTNWSSADVSNGFAAPTGFSLYAFAVNTGLTSNSPITLGESGASMGSFILAYGCTSNPGESANCAEGDIGQTVFTNSGLVGRTSVPEPGALALFAAGLGALGIVLLRRRRHERTPS